MARSISNPLHVARHLMAQDQAWLLFVQVALINPTGQYVRLVRNTRHLNGDGKVWQATAMEIDPPTEDADGSLGTATIRIPNITGMAGAFLEPVDRLSGATLTWWLQHESALTSFEPALSWWHKVLRATVDASTVAVECGHPAEAQRIPGPVFDRSRFPQLPSGGGVGY